MMRTLTIGPLAGTALAGMALAFWPVWIWFAKGILDKSNDYTGLLAAASAIAVLVRAGRLRAGRARLPAAGVAGGAFLLPALATALYIAAVLLGAAQAIAGALALFALAALASALLLGRRCDLALVSLCMLAMPLAATLQFYLGYPLRVLAGGLSATMLKMNGLAVLREGATLVWDGRLIAIDAPCSGVHMLWTGLYLACALAALHGMRSRRTLGAVLAAGAIVVLANALRAATLFYVEAGIVTLPGWGHEGIGMVCFIAAALAIVWSTQAIKGAAP